MKTLYQKESTDEIIARINELTPSTLRQWGKINVEQMLAPCVLGLERAIGTKYFPQLLFGKLIGRFFKSAEIGEKPIKKNNPTNPAFLIKSTDGFDKGKKITQPYQPILSRWGIEVYY